MLRYFITFMLVVVFLQLASGQINNDSPMHNLHALKDIKVGDSIKYLIPSLKVAIKNSNENVNKTIIPEFNDLKKNLFAKKDGFMLNKLSLDFSSNFFEDTTVRTTSTFRNPSVQMAYSVEANATLLCLPFSIVMRGNNNGYEYSQNTQSPFYKFNFDPQKYADNIKAKITTSLSPNVIANSTLLRINAIKQNYIQALKKDIDGINQVLTQQNQTRLSLPSDINDISDKDINSLQTKLLGGNELETYKASIEKIQNIQGKGNELIKDSSFIIATQNIKKYEALEKVFSKVLYWRKNYQNNQVIKELSSQLPFEKGGLSTYLSKPENLKNIVKDNFSLTSLQQLFMSVTKLNIGQNPLSGGGAFSPQNLINNGFDTEIKKSKIGVGLTYGQNNNINSLLQGGLTNQLTNEFTSLVGIKITRGNSNTVNQSVALNMFNFDNSSRLQRNGLLTQTDFLPTAQHKDAVITIHHAFVIKGIHKINIDFSKSFGSYVNSLSSDSLPVKNDAFNSLLSSTKGQSNYAFTIDYKGEIWKSDINVYVRNVGLGYNNPGNFLLRRGEKQLGLSFSRTFFKRRLNFKYNTDYRQQDFDPLKKYSFKTLSNKSQLGYRFNRNNKIGISYQRSDYLSKHPIQESISGNNVHIQIDGNYKFKWKNNVVINTTSLGKQQYNLPMSIGDNFKSNSYLFAHNSSMILKENVLALTVLGNSSDSRSYYFNTSYLSTEISYSYKLVKKINFTSGVGYYANYGWNKQVGISQQLNTSFNNKLSIDFQISYKKAIQIIIPDFANQIAFNSTIRYNL